MLVTQSMQKSLSLQKILYPVTQQKEKEIKGGSETVIPEFFERYLLLYASYSG
jgi:hypothetical protein